MSRRAGPSDLERTRADLRAVFDAAIEAVRGDRLLPRYASVEGGVWRYRREGAEFVVPLPARGSGGRLVVIGAGKAAAALAQGFEATLGDWPERHGVEVQGDIVVKHGHALALARLRVHEAGHPVSDAAGERATRAVLERLEGLGGNDVVVTLLTGGASALLAAPAEGLALEDEIRAGALLVRSGASIAEINTVRKHLSRVKGGRLRAAAGAARVYTLAISDVPGDDPSTIGSGPTVADPTTFADALRVIRRYGLEGEIPAAALAHLERGARGERPETPKPDANAQQPFLLLASNAQAVAAAQARGRALGYEVEGLPRILEGDTRLAARGLVERFALRLRGRPVEAAPLMLVGGGETTLKVAGAGRGGRNQEFALAAAEAFAAAGLADAMLLAAGTDGTDGPTDAAGAFADAATWTGGAALGLDPRRAQADNDCYRYLDALGALLRTGPTHTNVMDLAIVAQRRRCR